MILMRGRTDNTDSSISSFSINTSMKGYLIRIMIDFIQFRLFLLNRLHITDLQVITNF